MTTRPAIMEHPIYDTLVEEQGFDPESVTPIRTPEDRRASHDHWFDATVRKVNRATKPGAYRTPRQRKASE